VKLLVTYSARVMFSTSTAAASPRVRAVTAAAGFIMAMVEEGEDETLLAGAGNKGKEGEVHLDSRQ
jgi:hypothetical protein